jgi:alkaline phosphatase D
MKVMRAEYAKLAALPGYQKLLKTCPVLATWDDHDMGANDAGAEYPKKREAQQVFLDFFGVPKDDPRRKQEGVYHAAVFGPPGKRVQVILLDTRYFRSPLARRPRSVKGPGLYVANRDPKSTILGEAQWKWLEQQLRRPAEVRLLCSSIQLASEDHGFEKWMNFPHERERLFRLVRQTKAGGLIVLSGDRHMAELSRLDDAVGYTLFDLTSSGLNQGNKRWRALEKNRHRVAIMDVGNNFGMITIDWGRDDPLIGLEIRDESGDVTIRQKVPLSRLQPGRRKVKGEGPDLAAEALKHVGKEHTVEMVVQAVGKTRGGTHWFLNSLVDFRDERNFAVVLETKAVGPALKAAKVEDVARHFRGKKVRVRGVVSVFNGRPQIVVKDLKQVQVVD